MSNKEIPIIKEYGRFVFESESGSIEISNVVMTRIEKEYDIHERHGCEEYIKNGIVEITLKGRTK